MANSLLESYKNRVNIANQVYANTHFGQNMSETKKVMVAKCLDNISKYMNEALDNSAGVNRASLGAYKKFALNLTNVALPTLIAPELVIVSPMSSFTGYVTYLQYTAGSQKAPVNRGDVFNSTFALGAAQDKYTSSLVTASGSAPAAASNKISFTLNWTPVIPGNVLLSANHSGTLNYFFDKGDGKMYTATTAPTVETVTDANGNVNRTVTYPSGTECGTITYGTVRDVTYSAAATPAVIELDVTTSTGGADGKIAEGDAYELSYTYNNEYVPQNDVPLMNVEVKAIPLVAKVRRIAIYYSQIAAFQAKTDYDFDLQDQLAQKATGQLAYEIDTEVINLLADIAARNKTAGNFVPDWSRTLPVGVAKAEHYEGFAEAFGVANQIIYNATKRFAANYAVIASDILPILHFVKGFTAAPAGKINGPYFAGTLDSLRVFVSPALPAGKYLVGLNGDDMMSSAAVYAPYMPIVPTQLLQFADGATSQGFSTLYDLKELNGNLVVEGNVTGTAFSGVFGTATTPVNTHTIA